MDPSDISRSLGIHLVFFGGFDFLLPFRFTLCCTKSSFGFFFQTFCHALLLANLNLLHHCFHHLQLVLDAEEKVGITASRQMGFAQLVGHPIFHNGIHFIFIHINTHDIHELDHTNSKVPAVHPEFVSLGLLRDLGQFRVSFSFQGSFNVGTRLAILGPGFNTSGFGSDFLHIHTHRGEESLHDIFLHFYTFGVVLEQKIQGSHNAQTPQRIPLESGIHCDEMGGSHQICDHILVKRIDGVSQFFGELGKGFSNGANLGSHQVSVTTSEFGIRLSRLVVGAADFLFHVTSEQAAAQGSRGGSI
mmetsp:Transcript_4375/g.12056  ORF Transcript_4375/g.12056 Transcript_4375/m.12056 type:complete len:303 (-) Transcript_4375:255-1163(-)